MTDQDRLIQACAQAAVRLQAAEATFEASQRELLDAARESTRTAIALAVAVASAKCAPTPGDA